MNDNSKPQYKPYTGYALELNTKPAWKVTVKEARGILYPRWLRILTVVSYVISALCILAVIALFVAPLIFPYNAAAKLHGWERITATWYGWAWLLVH